VGCLTMIEPGGELSLLDRVEEYLRQHKLPPTRFGKSVVGSPSLVARMRCGKSLRRTTIERVEVFLATVPAIVRPRPMTPGQWKASRYRKAVQDNIRNDLAERERRLRDPCEQAAIHLRSRGWTITRAHVHEEGAVDWCVGSMRKDDDGLLAMARRQGWRG
jgi:hypothetical protein